MTRAEGAMQQRHRRGQLPAGRAVPHPCLFSAPWVAGRVHCSMHVDAAAAVTGLKARPLELVYSE